MAITVKNMGGVAVFTGEDGARNIGVRDEAGTRAMAAFKRFGVECLGSRTRILDERQGKETKFTLLRDHIVEAHEVVESRVHVVDEMTLRVGAEIRDIFPNKEGDFEREVHITVTVDVGRGFGGILSKAFPDAMITEEGVITLAVPETVEPNGDAYVTTMMERADKVITSFSAFVDPEKASDNILLNGCGKEAAAEDARTLVREIGEAARAVTDLDQVKDCRFLARLSLEWISNVGKVVGDAISKVRNAVRDGIADGYMGGGTPRRGRAINPFYEFKLGLYGGKDIDLSDQGLEGADKRLEPLIARKDASAPDSA